MVLVAALYTSNLIWLMPLASTPDACTLGNVPLIVPVGGLLTVSEGPSSPVKLALQLRPPAV